MDLMELALKHVAVDISSGIDFATTLHQQMEGEIVKGQGGVE